MKSLLLFIIFVFLFRLSEAQIPVESWRDHLPYSEATQCVKANNLIYCIGSNNLFYYIKDDNTYNNRLTKINGLSDIKISSIDFSVDEQILVIGYTNGNVDLIRDNEIFNISDIKRKQILGDKQINRIYTRESDAYLATGFGIVVLNLVKKEVKDTYLIGELGSNIQVFDITSDDEYIYASTANGILRADLSSQFLIDYNQWQYIKKLPDDSMKIIELEYFNDAIYAIFQYNDYGDDSIYYYKNAQWHPWEHNEKSEYHSITVTNDKMTVTSLYHANIYDINGNNFRRFGYQLEKPVYAIYDDEDQYIWIADKNKGLVKNTESWISIGVHPNGPANNGVSDIQITGDMVWVAGGSPKSPWGNRGMFVNENGLWTSINKNTTEGFDSIFNVSTLAIDPSNPGHIYGGSFGYGLVEILNNQVVNYYTEYNSILRSIENYGHGYLRVTGLDYDAYGNLYIATSLVRDPFFVLTNEGKLINLEFDYNGFGGSQNIDDLLVTSLNQKWVLMPGNGLFIFDDGGTPDDPGDDREKRIGIINEDGESVSSEVYSIAEDREGNIWVGTGQGPAIYYNPRNIFENPDVRCHQVKIPRNDGTGLADYLLGTEIITAIAVDGADRKWFGTEKSGVFLVSSDGAQQLKHFNDENSYLLSNNITSLAINDKNGEVFIGTDYGIVSYRAEATKASTEFGKVYAFPNPVREDYEGIITITGLAEDVNVKITDISGNIVFETTALGGQAIWDGRNFSGNRVHTGVYMAFCTNEDGTQTLVTKILFIH